MIKERVEFHVAVEIMFKRTSQTVTFLTIGHKLIIHIVFRALPRAVSEICVPVIDIKGAKIAYETIITDFSDSDNKLTNCIPLLGEKILKSFASKNNAGYMHITGKMGIKNLISFVDIKLIIR